MKKVKVPENNFFTNTVCFSCEVRNKTIQVEPKELPKEFRMWLKNPRATIKVKECPKCKERHFTLTRK